MREFFKFMFASMLGTFLIGIVLIVVFAVAMAAAIAGGLASAGSFGGGKPASIDSNSVLHLKLDEEIQDRGSSDDLHLDLGPFRSMNKLGLNDILEDLDRAKTDDRIKGIFLDLTSVQAGLATLSEIREKLVEFRKDSGKPVIAYSEFYTQGTYFLASAADRIYTVPEGDLDFRGLQTELMFFKGLFEKLGINVQFIKGSNNIYKSFGEAFTEKEMTPANHEQMQRLLAGLWGHYLERISETRKIDVQRLNGIADSLLIRYAPDAVTHGLIDGVKYRDEVLAIVKEQMGLEADKDIEFADLGKYDRATPTGKKEREEGKKSRIAVVYAQGSITSGESDDDVIGSETVSAALREAREDSTVKAIVFRVNSPGGSGLASDVIWREVQLCRQQGKPLVVSMGDLAASGGYYISCAAQRIYAEPTTITGSIGVFGIIPDYQGFFNDKLGITFDGDKTNRYADMFNVNRPMRDDERAIIQDYVDHFYSTFKQRVAEGRNMPVEKVDELGRGRVWTGIDAKENGLVDELGGLQAAIEGAAQLAGLEDYRTVNYPEEKGLLERILDDLNAETKAWVADEAFGGDVELMHQFNKVREVRRMTGIQARLPYEISVR